MRFKRLMAIILLAALVFTAFSAVVPFANAADPSGVWNAYFRNQLSDDARVLYDAMVRMYEDGTFTTGTESLDLTEKGFLTQDKVAAYMDAEDLSAGGLLEDFGAARDAFWADYPSVFYVDFSNLSIRVTTDSSDKYHVYIGTGRTETYFTRGFETRAQVEAAIDAYASALSTIVEGAKTVAPRVGQSVEAAQVEYVHDALTRSISYRLEDVCKTENIGFIRTSYGALVKHEGVCEAYTRAFKAVMDELGIPCVMVNGVYLHNADTPEVHIWNYVQLDGEWFGVDVTMDDPRPPQNRAPKNDVGLDGYESHEYLLRGDLAMGQKHVPVGIMSSANYEFMYPSLAMEDYGVNVITRDDGFSVSFKQDGKTDDGEVAAGEFFISYRGMGCEAARKAGYWFLERFWTRDENGELVPDQWHYILTDVYNLDDHETYLHLSYAQVEFVEFAVTEVSPGPYLEDPFTYMWYVGDPGSIGPQSGMIYNANSGYKAPPYPKYVTPVMNQKMYITGNAYHVTIEYNDDLRLASEDATVGVEMSAFRYRTDRSQQVIENIEQRAKIENIQWDGYRTVTFDFSPSEYYADDSIFYRLFVTGLVGISSGKAPVEISYGAGHASSYCSLGVGGFNWRVFAQPMLVDNTDLSMSGWEMSDGSIPSELLASRLTLVASSASPAQTEAMNDLIKGEGESLVASQTYNISLTLCKGCISKLGDGQSLRISLGFPEGYGPDDEGVTFKAYHFMKDANGEVVGVEEIPCTITRYGLIIECHSFSPFAIAVVEGESERTDRGVILTNTQHGSAVSEKGTMFSLPEGGTASVVISADAGYVIESVTVAGNVIAGAVGQERYELRLDYSDLEDAADNIVNITFTAKTVYDEDVKKGETVQIPPAVVPHTHTWGDMIYDETGHYRTCIDCGASEAKTAHTGGTATCSDHAKCEVCGAAYGELNPQYHIGPLVMKNQKMPTEDEDGYRGDLYCEGCGAMVSRGYVVPKLKHEHRFETKNSDDGSHWMECRCGARDNVTAHHFGEYTATASAHTHVCDDCGHIVSESHIPNADDLDCSTPVSCSVCGYVMDEARAHTWGAWVSVGDSHVAECLNENCDAVRSEKHTGGTATCHSAAVCDICSLPYGDKDAANHVGGTELRGYAAPTESEYGYSGDLYCLGCDAKIEDGHELEKLPAAHQHAFKEGYDGAGHWLICGCGVRKDDSYAVHLYDGYIETADGHSRACIECGYVSDVESHIPGDNSNCQTAVYCTVCMYEMFPARTHNFGGVLFSDEHGHWHICTNEGCTQSDGKTAHSGGTATCTKQAVCDDCFAAYGGLDSENHVVTELRGYKEATDGEEGYTGDIYCVDCGVCIKEGSVIRKTEPKPGDTGSGTETTETPDVTQSGSESDAGKPDTGDTGIGLWLVLMILSGVTACTAAFRGRLRKYDAFHR